MAKRSIQAIKQVFSKKKKNIYSGRGEEFKYWKRYVDREMDTVRGPEIDHLFEGYKRRQEHQWYYDDTPPFTTPSKVKQTWENTEMPLVKPLKEWHIFLGDRVEVLVGRDKGKIGEVVQIIKETNWCIVEGLHLQYRDRGSNSHKKHLRSIPSWIGIEQPLLVTTEVKLIDPADLRATEFEWRYTEEGERVRVSVRSGRLIPIPGRHKTTWEDYTNVSEIKPTQKDTIASNVEKVTFEPKLCTFEEDIARSMGIPYNKKNRRRSYWY